MTIRVAIAIAVSLIAATATPVAFADVVTGQRATWVPDGEVKAVAVSGSTAYIGGNFSRVAPYTGSSASFDAATGARNEVWPEVVGVVNAAISDNAGGWYLGGDFTFVGGVPRTDLAHVLADGSVDPDWAPTTNGTVRALATSGVDGPVYAGGEFTSANGDNRLNLAGFNGTDGALTPFSASVFESTLEDFEGPHVLLLDGTTLYAGGVFDRASGANLSNATRNHAAAFDVTNSNLLTWNPNTNHTVNGLARSGSEIFVGGRFNQVQGAQHHGIAKVHATTGAPNSAWVAPIQFGPELVDIVVSGDLVYIAGFSIRFSSDPGAPKFPAAALGVNDAALRINWDPLPQNSTTQVTSLAASGSTIYLGTASPGPKSGLMAVDAVNGDLTSFGSVEFGRGKIQFPSGQRTGVFGLGADGSEVVAGGTFMIAGGVARRNLAAIDLETGEATGFDPPLDGPGFPLFESVEAIAVAGGVVWAGGDFTTEGPDPRTALAAFDPPTGAIASFDRQPNTGPVYALAAFGSTVYVGGQFTSIGGESRGNVAAVQHVPGEAGTVLPFDPDANSRVLALAVSGDTVYLGGAFTEINGSIASLLKPRNFLAAVDATTGLGLPWDPNADAGVSALVADGDTVFAGGGFTMVNGSTSRERLAAFDAETGTARSWNPGADAPVRALALHGATVFAAGEFTTAGGVARNTLAALDATTGAPDAFAPDLVPEERNGPLHPPVVRTTALAATADSGLWAGGTFVMNALAPRVANLGAFGLAPLPDPGDGGDGGDGDGPGGSGGPGDPGGPRGTPAAPDGVAPELALAATRRRFRVGRAATPVDGTATAAQRRRRRAPRGTTLTLGLSEAARVRFEVFRKRKGRRVRKRCVKPTPRNRSRRRCVRRIPRGAFTRSALAGRSTVKWSGRIGTQALKRGRYVLRATATDGAGNAGVQRRLAFRIIR